MSDEPMAYDPFEPRRPKGKPKGKAAAAGDETTITLRLPDGRETPPVTMAEMSAALDQIESDSDARIRRADATRANGVAGAELLQFIERVERLEEEKKAIADDIKDVFGEAKGRGFDNKAMRSIIRLRKQDPAERAEFEAILDTYMTALGML